MKPILILLGLLCGALSYWLNPYDQPYVLGISIYYFMGGSMILAGILGGARYTSSPLRITGFLVLGFTLGVIARIVFDIAEDSTTHNLAPFEIMIALAIAVPASFLGTFIGLKVFNRRD